MTMLSIRDSWITATDVCVALGLNPRQVKKLAVSGEIKTRTLAGMPPRYSRADVEKVAKKLAGDEKPEVKAKGK